MKNKSTTTLLCFFLGGIGAHHYYLGNTGKGILYSIFAITLIPGLISFIEFIMLATMSNNDFNLKYNAAYIDHSEEQSKNLDQLSKLHDLKVKGAISEDEYLKRKEKLIA